MLSMSVLYITSPDLELAKTIANTLLTEKLVACANIFPSGHSIYRWEGEIQNETEVIMILKTRSELVSRATERALALHKYDCPCVVSWPIQSGNPGFLQWLAEQTGDAQKT